MSYILNTSCSDDCSPHVVHICTLPMLSLPDTLLILFVMFYFALFYLNTSCSDDCSPHAVHKCTLPMLSLPDTLLILFVMFYFGLFYFEHFVFRWLLASRGAWMHPSDDLLNGCSFDFICYVFIVSFILNTSCLSVNHLIRYSY